MMAITTSSSISVNAARPRTGQILGKFIKAPFSTKERFVGVGCGSAPGWVGDEQLFGQSLKPATDPATADRQKGYKNECPQSIWHRTEIPAGCQLLPKASSRETWPGS